MSEDQLKNEEQVINQPPEKQPKKSFGWLIFGIINFILILLLAGGGYYLLGNIKDKQQLQDSVISKDEMRAIETSKQVNTFQTQISALQSHIANFSEDITGKDNHFTSTLKKFSDLHAEKLDTSHKELSTEILQLKRQLGKTRGDWLVADAEYLLSVANQRLHLMSDVKTTQLALEAADQRLRESGDSAVFKVRSQIVKEIASLQTVQQVDIVGLYASIESLKDNVKLLTLDLPYAGKPLATENTIPQEEESQNILINSAIDLLEGYVTVKHSEHAITKVLSLEEADFIRQQLNIKVEMLKIALVQQDEALYKASITDIKAWSANHFTQNSEAGRFLAVIQKLELVQLNSQLPNISQSLKMLKDITKLRLETDKAMSKDSKKPARSLPAVRGK